MQKKSARFFSNTNSTATPQTVQTQAPASTTKNFRDTVFGLLYSINGPDQNTNQIASITEKKIAYLPGELVIQDLSIIDDDHFFELLGYLLDEDAVNGLELPDVNHLSKPLKATYRYIRKELTQFGFPPELYRNSKDGKFRINLVKSN